MAKDFSFDIVSQVSMPEVAPVVDNELPCAIASRLGELNNDEAALVRQPDPLSFEELHAKSPFRQRTLWADASSLRFGREQPRRPAGEAARS